MITQKLTQQLKLRAIYKLQLQQLLDKMHLNMNAIERLNKRIQVEANKSHVFKFPDEEIINNKGE